MNIDEDGFNDANNDEVNSDDDGGFNDLNEDRVNIDHDMSASVQQTECPQWTRLNPCPTEPPKYEVQKAWYLEDGCFMIFSFVRQSLENNWHHCLYKYDMCSGTWTRFLSDLFEIIQRLKAGQIEFDWVKRRIFILTGQPFTTWPDASTYILDMDNQSLQHFRGIPEGQLINVNGIIHCVSDRSSLCHNIWNDVKQQWQPINVAFPLNAGGSFQSQVIHVPSKHILLLFRWWSGSRAMSVWRHRIGSNRWTRVLQKGPWQGVTGSVVLSSDEQFVIMAQPHLWILDISNDDQYKVRKSTVAFEEHSDGVWCATCLASPNSQAICSPRIIAHSDCAFGSDTLVSGFIWRLQLDMDIPLVIVNLIAEWCSVERIHWITKIMLPNGTPNHLMMPLRTICLNAQEM